MNEPSKDSIQCDLKQIELLLDENCDQLLKAELQSHLESCEQCRSYLDAEAATADLWNEAQSLLQVDEFDSETFLGSTSRYEYPSGIGSSSICRSDAVGSSMIEAVVESLTPSEHPERLGRIGNYEVTGVIGSGGMSVVLKAIESALDRVVAIKVMSPLLAGSGAARKRFAREAKAAAAVIHPCVISIHGVSNNVAGLPYLVMEYIGGGSLQNRLKQQGALNPVEVVRIGSQIGSGLAAAHEQGLVHRDIKPANILLQKNVERISITDFGLARAVDDASITHDGSIAGTPEYMSPEQSRGESVDQQSDLFCLGSLLYATATGRAPFRADSSYGVMRRICDEHPIPIRDLNPEMPNWLCLIIEKLMAKSASATAWTDSGGRLRVVHPHPYLNKDRVPFPFKSTLPQDHSHLPLFNTASRPRPRMASQPKSRASRRARLLTLTG